MQLGVVTREWQSEHEPGEGKVLGLCNQTFCSVGLDSKGNARGLGIYLALCQWVASSPVAENQEL